MKVRKSKKKLCFQISNIPRVVGLIQPWPGILIFGLPDVDMNSEKHNKLHFHLNSWVSLYHYVEVS